MDSSKRPCGPKIEILDDHCATVPHIDPCISFGQKRFDIKTTIKERADSNHMARVTVRRACGV
jgi:hypothetical protein